MQSGVVTQDSASLTQAGVPVTSRAINCVEHRSMQKKKQDLICMDGVVTKFIGLIILFNGCVDLDHGFSHAARTPHLVV